MWFVWFFTVFFWFDFCKVSRLSYRAPCLPRCFCSNQRSQPSKITSQVYLRKCLQKAVVFFQERLMLAEYTRFLLESFQLARFFHFNVAREQRRVGAEISAPNFTHANNVGPVLKCFREKRICDAQNNMRSVKETNKKKHPIRHSKTYGSLHFDVYSLNSLSCMVK